MIVYMTEQEKRVALAIFPSVDFPSHHHIEAARRAIAAVPKPTGDTQCDAVRRIFERL